MSADLQILCRGPGGDFHGEHKPREMVGDEDLQDAQLECPECHTVIDISGGAA